MELRTFYDHTAYFQIFHPDSLAKAGYGPNPRIVELEKCPESVVLAAINGLLAQIGLLPFVR